MRKSLFTASTSGDTHHSASRVFDDAQWRRRVVLEVIERLQQVRLCIEKEQKKHQIKAKVGRSVCQQLRTRLAQAHANFDNSITRLQHIHSDRLAAAENRRLRLRRTHAPRLARLTMESMAARDSLLYGKQKIFKKMSTNQTRHATPWS